MNIGPEIWITGYGIISALGKNVPDSLDSLLKRKMTLQKLSGFDSVFNHQLTVGQVNLSNEELSALINPDDGTIYSRSSLLAFIACSEALTHAGEGIDFQELALVTGSTVGGVGVTLSKLPDINKGLYTADEAFINVMDCGSVGRHVASHFKIGGTITTISTACASASNALLTGARMIKNGRVRQAICGGSDSLELFTINGFNSLKNMDAAPCKPFSADRNGLNLGEGAGYLLLESADNARARGAKPLAIMSGACNSVETFHITGSSPDGEGAVMAMKGALQNAGLQPEDIDYIHAHGTATIDNDLAEGVAIQNVFGNEVQFSSSKSLTGHTLAASGSIATILTIIAMNHQFILPNENFSTAIPEHGLTPVHRLLPNKITRHAMINSFGFGGSNTTIIISKPPNP